MAITRFDQSGICSRTFAMPFPQPGDILIRNLQADRFELVDVITLKYLAGPFNSFPDAVRAAHQRHARAIWQQNVDARGRPLGEPFRLPDLP
jgi:hypothetical protein